MPRSWKTVSCCSRLSCGPWLPSVPLSQRVGMLQVHVAVSGRVPSSQGACWALPPGCHLLDFQETVPTHVGWWESRGLAPHTFLGSARCTAAPMCCTSRWWPGVTGQCPMESSHSGLSASGQNFGGRHLPATPRPSLCTSTPATLTSPRTKNGP